jgi:hypothetical protein
MDRMEVIMVKMKVFFILFCILATRPTSGEMNWQTFTLRASAVDKDDAFDLLTKEFYSLQYDQTMLINDFLELNPHLTGQISNLLLEYRVLKQNYLTDGGTEYVYNLCLTNKIMYSLLPKPSKVKLVVPMLCPYCGQEWPLNKPVPEGIELVPKEIETSFYTGIIIDCRGFDLKPCIFPKIYDNTMREIYSVNFADKNSIIDRGLILYSQKDLGNDPRIGQKPLRIKAVDITGRARTDIIITESDAFRMHGSKNNLKLLKECRVAVIFGP